MDDNDVRPTDPTDSPLVTDRSATPEEAEAQVFAEALAEEERPLVRRPVRYGAAGLALAALAAVLLWRRGRDRSKFRRLGELGNEALGVTGEIAADYRAATGRATRRAVKRARKRAAAAAKDARRSAPKTARKARVRTRKAAGNAAAALGDRTRQGTAALTEQARHGVSVAGDRVRRVR